MTPAIYLSRGQFRRLNRLPRRLLLFIGAGFIVAAFVAKSGSSNAHAPIHPIPPLYSTLLFLTVGLVLASDVVRSRVRQKSLCSETENFLIRKKQFANRGEQSPLVLIAAADVPLRSALELHLARAGFRVEYASNGREVLTKTNKQTAVVLLDLVMPGAPGFHHLRNIRKSSAGMKVIAITRKNHALDAVLCRKLGAYHSLPKPLDPDDVLEIVSRAVNNVPHAPADFELRPTRQYA